MKNVRRRDLLLFTKRSSSNKEISLFCKKRERESLAIDESPLEDPIQLDSRLVPSSCRNYDG